jgi:nicotinamidase-related amidase
VTAGLLVIDIQNDYFPGGRMEVPDSTASAGRAGELLAAFREGGLPIFHLQHLAARPDATFFLPGTTGAEIHPSARPRDAEPVFQKHFPNGFRETGLLEAVRAAGVDRLVLCGMMTQMCVDATTRAAFDLGFRCQVAHDACAARPMTFAGRAVAAPDVHAAFLAALAGVYAKVATAEAIVAEVSGRPAP